MDRPKQNHRLSSLDATFLYLEKKECPLHIGSASVFDGPLSIEEVKKHVGDRLHLIPRYRQKVVPDPFGISHPTWEFDEEFDIDDHIFEIERQGKVSIEDLSEIAGEQMTTLMDRAKPLWELHLVNGLSGGKSGLIAKVHHCMVDGISGVDLIKILFDIKPEADPPPPPPKTGFEARKLDPTRKLFDSILGSMEEGMNRFLELQAGLMYLTANLANPKIAEKLPKIADVLPSVAAPVAILPFNKECNGIRKLAWSEYSFSEARLIKNFLEGTVNDVVLTVLSEAVTRYARQHGTETADRKVRFMMPVSLRQKEQRGSLGNLISIIPVEIPLEFDCLEERFRYVHDKTAMMKETRLAESLLTVGAAYSLLPAPMQSVIGALADTPVPPFNLVATNVPGPQIPLYLTGRKMLAHYPYVPIGYGLGLGCAIFSYNKKLYFGLSSDAGAMDDVSFFKKKLDEVFAEMLAIAKEKKGKADSARA